jgi:ParB/RepB/Spo0J family partition protein
MTLKAIPLHRLQPARLRIRGADRDDAGEDFDTLLATVREKGLQQNLIVCAAGGGKYEVYAGQRRLRALRILEKEGAVAPSLPVDCLVKPSPEEAEAAAAVENVARRPMHPVAEWRAFERLARKTSPESLALTFGWDERKRDRMLALGRIAPAILEECEAGGIGLDAARAYARLPGREEQLKLYKSLKCAGQHGDEHAVLRAVDRRRIPVGRNIFELKASGLEVVGDLFDDRHSYFADNAAFWDKQRAAVRALADRLRGDGWGEVEVGESDRGGLPPAHAEQATEKLARAKRGGGGANVNLRPDGSVEVLYWLKREAARKAVGKKAGKNEAGEGGGGGHDDGPERAAAASAEEREDEGGGGEQSEPAGVEYPKAVAMDLYRVKTLMLQLAVAENDRGALAYLVFGLLTMAVRLDPGHRALDSRRPVQRDGALAKSELASRLSAADDLLRTDLLPLLEGGDPEAAPALSPAGRAELLAGLCGLSLKALARLIAGLLARRIGYFDANRLPEEPGGVLDALGAALGVEPWRLWRPDLAFFAKLPRAALREIASLFGEEFVRHHRKEGRAALAQSLARRFALHQSLETDPLAAHVKATWVPASLEFGAPADTKRADG